jgi:molybdate-binding protein/DNA-binding XRE family transcriptional regulator
MTKGRLGCGLKARREQAGLSQAEIAKRVGVARQTVIAVEAGRHAPSAAVALRLASVLGCRVEDLFWIDEPERLPVSLVDGEAPPEGARLVVGAVGGRWVAHPLAAAQPETWLTPADGLLEETPRQRGKRRSTAELLSRPDLLRTNLLVAGCAPALGLLARRLSESNMGIRLRWIHAPSDRALELLARGDLHLAGAHLFDEKSQSFNVPFVRRRFRKRRMLVVRFFEWEEGLVVQAGNPRGIRGVEDLLRPDARVARRQPGAGAQRLLERLLRPFGDLPPQLSSGPLARSHAEVGQLVAHGVADAGVALLSTAESLGLEFLPLAAEDFDLVVPGELCEEPAWQRLVEAIGGRAFRAELRRLGGLGTAHTGDLVTEVAA